jgi:hypothetical protein
MRTKALLLAAAFAAAGVSTSVAQVYSVNAVGYVNVSIPPGFSMVSNPLDAGAGNNTVGKLFSNITGGVPPFFKVFSWNETANTYNTAANYIPGVGFGTGPAATAEVLPGRGAFVFNPNAAGTAPLTLTFVGEVPQGNLSNPIPTGFSIKASQVPQAGKPETLGTLPGALGDKIFRYNKAQQTYYTASNFIPGAGWVPATQPIEVGEAFFFFRAPQNGAAAWTRTFSVNG